MVDELVATVKVPSVQFLSTGFYNFICEILRLCSVGSTALKRGRYFLPRISTDFRGFSIPIRVNP